MADDGEGRGNGGADERDRSSRRRVPMTPGEVWKLVMGTYRVSLPYLLVFVGGILLATWILTELVF